MRFRSGNECICIQRYDFPATGYTFADILVIEDDLKELEEVDPDATTIQLLSANPLCMTYEKFAPILENEINHGDMDFLAAVRRSKRTLWWERSLRQAGCAPALDGDEIIMLSYIIVLVHILDTEIGHIYKREIEHILDQQDV